MLANAGGQGLRFTQFYSCLEMVIVHDFKDRLSRFTIFNKTTHASLSQILET